MQDKIAFALLSILAIVIFSSLILGIWLIPDSKTEKKVPCYDKRNNPIEGLTCTQTKAGMPLEVKLSFTILIILGIIFIVSYTYIHIQINRTGGKNGRY